MPVQVRFLEVAHQDCVPVPVRAPRPPAGHSKGQHGLVRVGVARSGGLRHPGATQEARGQVRSAGAPAAAPVEQEPGGCGRGSRGGWPARPRLAPRTNAAVRTPSRGWPGAGGRGLKAAGQAAARAPLQAPAATRLPEGARRASSKHRVARGGPRRPQQRGTGQEDTPRQKTPSTCQRLPPRRLETAETLCCSTKLTVLRLETNRNGLPRASG